MAAAAGARTRLGSLAISKLSYIRISRISFEATFHGRSDSDAPAEWATVKYFKTLVNFDHHPIC